MSETHAILHNPARMSVNSDRLRGDPPNLSSPEPVNMAQRVFEIDELARLLSYHLISVNCGAVVSFARTCKMLEVPALSSLWEQQDSFSVLIGVLPTTDEVRDPCHTPRSYLTLR